MTTKTTRPRSINRHEAEQRFVKRLNESAHRAAQVTEELIGDYFAYQSSEAKTLLDLVPRLGDDRLDACVAAIRAGARLPCECAPVHAQYLRERVTSAKPIHDYESRRDLVMRYRKLLYEYANLSHIMELWQCDNREAFRAALSKLERQINRNDRFQEKLPMAIVADAPDMPAPLFNHGPAPGGFGLIIGADGVGKGWLTLDLLLGCALARPMNIPRFQRDGEPLRVMYLSYEDDPSVLRNRLDSLCAAAAENPGLWREREASGHFQVFTDLAPLFTQTGYNAPRATDTLRALDATIRQERMQLCVIDPLAAAVAVQNENDNSTLNSMAVTLRRLARDTQCAILISHHTSKTRREAEEQHAARGGSALTGAARWVLRVIQNPDNPDMLTVNIPKNSYGPALTAAPLERLPEGPLREISPDRVAQVSENMMRKVLKFIRQNPDLEINPNAVRNSGSPGARRLCATVNASPAQVVHIVNQALDAGLLKTERRRHKSNGRNYAVLVPKK